MNTITSIEPAIGDCRPLEDLQNPDFVYVDLDRNIHDMAEQMGFRASETSAVLVEYANSDIGQVWTTDSARPFELHASYTRLH